MANPQVIVEFIANAAKLQSEVGKIEQSGGRLKSWGKKAGLAIGGAFAVTAAVKFGKASVQAAQEAEVATNRLEQVFRSMGDTTGQAAQAAVDYAGALSKKIGVDDEVIMQGQAILATFKAVSDETARQAGIFDRATAASADLAAAGFGSIESNAVALGKALQDPVKGITALARSGVTFTEQEKEKIKTLVESGKTLEAQKLILKAIEGQVKGTAEATATDSEKMAVAYGEVQESVGKGLLPALQALAPIIVALSGLIAENTDLLIPLAVGLLGVAAAIKIVTLAQTLFNLALSASVIGLIIVAVAALAVGLYLLYKNWDTVVAAFKTGLGAIKKAALAVFNWLKANWPKIVAVMAGPMGVAIYLIIKNWDKLKAATKAAISAIGNVIKTLWNAAKWVADKIKGVFTALVNWLKGLGAKIRSAMSTVGTALKGPLNAIIGAWNALRIPGFSVTIPGPGPVPDIDFSWGGYNLPDIPKLAMGGIVTRPTLAMLGEGGPEAIVPLSGPGGLEVRVFIGDQELRGIIQTEVVRTNSATARLLMAGAS